MMDIYHGDCLEVLRGMPADLVDAVVTDPPAGISFMGKGWDTFCGRANVNAESNRNAANRGPGAGLGNQPFGYGGSTPADSAKGRKAFVAFLAERLAECLRVAKPGAHALVWALPRTSHWTATAIEDAGWVIEDRVAHIFGTGFPKHKSKLKPATEDWWLATKPGGKKWLGVNVCRIETSEKLQGSTVQNDMRGGHFASGHRPNPGDIPDYRQNAAGRWPTNLVLSHHPECNGDCHPDCPVAMLDEQSGESKSQRRELLGWASDKHEGWKREAQKNYKPIVGGYDDSGGASRFFPGFLYCPKASRKDRGEGNNHPTVKAEPLMRWLCKLVTPPRGTVLDPFAGSGSTGLAAEAEGFRAILIEQSEEYIAIIRSRIAMFAEETPLFSGSGLA